MGRNITKKKSNKIKRYRYIEVEEVENWYIDATLLKCCGKGTIASVLSDKLKIIKKAGITTQDLKQNKYSDEELVRKVSPHLLEDYEFYNFMVNRWDEVQEKTLNNIFNENYTNFTLDQWDMEIRKLIDKEVVPLYIAVNILRFYKNGEFKELIKLLLEEKEYAIKFYYETHIQIEGLDIDWEEVSENQFDDIFDINEEPEELDMPEKELLERKPEEALKIAAEIIKGVAERVTGLDEVQKYKELYESEKEKVLLFAEKISGLNQESKSKDHQTQSLLKENRILTKNVNTLNNKVEQQQRETGRLGQSLGEVRKEKEELEKINTNLERRLNSLKKEQNSIAEIMEKDVKKEYESKSLKMQIEYDEKLDTSKSQLEEMKKFLDEEQAKNQILSVGLESMKKELDTIKNDLRVVENERNELVERFKSASDNTNDKVATEEDDDLLFDFNEEEIEDFVEFDNKPTRN